MLCKNEQCSNEFDNPRGIKKFCSDKCRMQYHKNGINNFKNISGTDLDNQKIGYYSLMRVCADLTMHNYDVFLPLYNADCDIIISKNEKIFRVEVKTGFYKSGKLRTGALRKNKYDILAIFDPQSDKVTYNPSLP